MKKISIFFCLLLCLSALVSCGRSSSQSETSTVTTETPVLDLHNTTATRYYGCLSSDTLYIIDYNAEGKLLAVNELDTNTLHANPLPKEKPTLQHTYNENGKLISHIFSGAELAIRYDDRGYPLAAKGYNSSGTAYNVTYTCDSNGNILTETYTKGELPWAITNDIVCEYDADGRLLTYGDAALSYQNGVLSTIITETYEDVTHIITRNDKGLPAAWLVNGEETSRWHYDDNGRLLLREPLTDHILPVELVYNDDGTLASYTYTEGDNSEKPSCQTVCIFTYNDRGELITYEERSRDYEEGKGENHITSYENGVRTGITTDYLTISEDRTETLTRRFLTTYDNRSNTRFVDAYTPNEDGVLGKAHSAFTVYDALNREIHYTSREPVNLNNPPKYPCEIFVKYDDDSNIIQITEKQKEDIEYYGADRTETRDYQNGTLCLETTELSWTDEEGNQHYQIDILPYVAGQADFEYSSQKFVNNVLFYEQKLEKNRDPDADSSGFSTYIYYEPHNLKETGQNVKTVIVETYKKDGTREYVTSTYEKDILRQRETENRENKKQAVGEDILLSRTVTSKIEIFNADGVLSSTEICSYVYHETTYLASIDGEIYDGNGNLTKRYRKEYSDTGELLTSTEESVA